MRLARLPGGRRDTASQSSGVEAFALEPVFSGKRKIANLIGIGLWAAAMLYFWAWWLQRRRDACRFTIYGDGSQTRSLCYVDDMVGGLIALMESADDITGPINLGNPGEFTVRELAEQIISMTGSTSEIEYAPLPEDDPHRRRPNISLAIRELQWRPTVDLEVGLARTIGYFRRQFTIERVPSAPPVPRLPRTTKRIRGTKRKSAPLAPA